MSTTPDYTLVVPVYFNAGSLEQLHDNISQQVFRACAPLRGEVVFIDDGSGDDSWGVIREVQAKDPGSVRGIKLSRNFGQMNAIWCGIQHAKGRAVCVMSADGQDPAETAVRMLREHFEGGHEIVIGTRAEREESAFRRWTSHFFYVLMRAMAFPGMPEGGFDFYVLGERAMKVLLATMEVHAFGQGKILQLGFSPLFVPYTRRARTHGKSRWGFWRKVTYLLDGIIGNSFLPIRLMSLAGILFAFCGFAYAGLIFLNRLLYGHPVYGWAPLMIAILVIGGFQMLMLGVIGEYVWRALALVKKQAPYVVDVVLEAEGPSGGEKQG